MLGLGATGPERGQAPLGLTLFHSCSLCCSLRATSDAAATARQDQVEPAALTLVESRELQTGLCP